MSSLRFVRCLVLAVLFCAPAAHAGAKRPVVVELFTSQGCSSCPPADLLLARLADRRDVLAFSLPVTYWDMLGWRDTLASEANSRRQKAYAAFMSRGGVYTPQMIVDGTSDVVGGRETAIEAAIAARTADELSVPVELRAAKNEIHIGVGAGNGSEAAATIWLFRVLGRASVSVGAGENGGHTLAYRNVVRDVQAVGIWKGQPVSLDLPRTDVPPHDALAVIVQQSGYGRILGAAFITRPEYPAGW
jgi:hypothetical protein